MKFRTPLLAVAILLLSTTGFGQKTQITISFSEQFFDALLDAVFQHAAPPEFSLAAANFPATPAIANSFAPQEACDQTIRLLRENGGKRTSVRFRDGRIMAPIAFIGKYDTPLIGCLPFSGVAETNVELAFDAAAQRLIARAKVKDVSLNGTAGIGGGLIARMVQSAIDRKINPIEIIRTDKVSFVLPLQNSHSVKMRATGFTHDVADGQLNVRVGYEFEKAP